ncbi:hypothetical protein QYM36_005712 [Artemia franciscana]|uniref:Uncharacterized protein n=1 Tax=Artemia franciscana TaxID=6661 RepID=A0AA88I1Z3_ARTSF|nr:hypothetical protein QYM36_005712 [Artemia franciscana]
MTFVYKLSYILAESRISDLPYYDYELDAEESAGYESVVTASTVDDYTERCPCKRRTDCSNPYGSSVYDIQNYGVIPPCSQYGMVPCCKRSILTFDQDDSTRPDPATLFGPVLPADQSLDNPDEIAIYYKESDLDGPMNFDDNQTVFIDQIPSKDLPMEHRDALKSVSVVNEAVKSDYNDTKGISAYAIASSSDKNQFEGVNKGTAYEEKSFSQASSTNLEDLPGKKYSAVSEKGSSSYKSSEASNQPTVSTIIEKEIISTTTDSSENLTQNNYYPFVNESKTEESSILPSQKPIVQQSFTRFYTEPAKYFKEIPATIPEINSRLQEQKPGIIHFPSNQVRFYEPEQVETVQMNVHSQTAMFKPQFQNMIMYPIRQHQGLNYPLQASSVPADMVSKPYAPSTSYLSQKLPQALNVQSKIIQAADIKEKIVNVAGVHSNFAKVAEIQDKVIEDIQQKKIRYGFSHQQIINSQEPLNVPPPNFVPNTYNVDQSPQYQFGKSGFAIHQVADSKPSPEAPLDADSSTIFTPNVHENSYGVVQSSQEQNLMSNFGSFQVDDSKFLQKAPLVSVTSSFIAPNAQSDEYKFIQSPWQQHPMAGFGTQKVKVFTEFAKKTPSVTVTPSDTPVPLGLIFRPAAHRYLTGSSPSEISHLSPSSVYTPSSLYTSQHEPKVPEQKLEIPSNLYQTEWSPVYTPSPVYTSHHEPKVPEQKLEIPSNLYQTNWSKSMPHNTPMTKYGTDSGITPNNHFSSLDSTKYEESPHSNVSPVLRPGIHSISPSMTMNQFAASAPEISGGNISTPIISNEFQSTGMKSQDYKLNRPINYSTFENLVPEKASDLTLSSFHYSSPDQFPLGHAQTSVKHTPHANLNIGALQQNSDKSAEALAMHNIPFGIKQSNHKNSTFKETPNKQALPIHSVDQLPSYAASSQDKINLEDIKMFQQNDMPVYPKLAESLSNLETSQNVHEIRPLKVSSQMVKDYAPISEGSINLQDNRPEAPFKSETKVVHQSAVTNGKNAETSHPSIIAHSAVGLQQPTFNSSSKHSVTMYYTGTKDFDVNLKRLEELVNQTKPYESLNKEVKNEKAPQSPLWLEPEMNEIVPVFHKKYEQPTTKVAYVQTATTTQSIDIVKETTPQTSTVLATTKSQYALPQSTTPKYVQPETEAAIKISEVVSSNINSATLATETKAPYLNRKEKVRAKLYGKDHGKVNAQRLSGLQKNALFQNQNMPVLNSQEVVKATGPANNQQYHEQIRAPVSVYMPSDLPVRPRVQPMNNNVSPTASTQQHIPNKAPFNFARPSAPQQMNIFQSAQQSQNSLNPSLTNHPMNVQPFRPLTANPGGAMPAQPSHPRPSYPTPNFLPRPMIQRPTYPNAQQSNYGSTTKYPVKQKPQVMPPGYAMRPQYPTAQPIMAQSPGKTKGKDNQKEKHNESFSMGKELIHAGKDLLGSGKDKLHHSIESTKDKIHSSLESGKDKFHQTVESGKEMFDDTKHIGKEVLKFLVPTIKPSFLFGKDEKKPQNAPENLVFLQTSPAYQPNIPVMQPNTPAMRPNIPAMRPNYTPMRPIAPNMRPQQGYAPYAPYQGY